MNNNKDLLKMCTTTELYQRIIDELVAKDIINEHYKFSAKSFKLLNNNTPLKQQIYDITSFADPEDNYQIRIMYILNFLTETPKCKTCGIKVGPSKIYTQRGKFAEYCSRECTNRKEIMKKAKQTYLTKYGVDNPGKCEEFQKKREETNLERYGARYAQQTTPVKQKITNTMQEKYGVNRPLQNSTLKQKAEQTLQEKYGATNPGLVDEFVKKKTETLIERYGVDNPFKSPEIQEQIKQTNLEKYGVDNPSKSPEIRERIKQTNLEKYGVDNSSKKHFSAEQIEDLNDINMLTELHHKQKWTHTKIARQLKVPQPTLSNYMKKHNIETKYFRSSQGERDMNDFIVSLGIETITNSRSIIPPYELDIYIPSHNLAIEYNGIFWHSVEAGRDKDYHAKKTQLCQERGIRLIQILEPEWLERPNNVKDLIKKSLNIHDTAIKSCMCSSVLLEHHYTTEFFDENHFQGYKLCEIAIGLIYDDKIVSAMSFRESESGWEIVQHHDVVGMKVENSFEYIVEIFKEQVQTSYLLFSVGKRWQTAKNEWSVVETQQPKQHKFISVDENGEQEIVLFDCGTEIVIV